VFVPLLSKEDYFLFVNFTECITSLNIYIVGGRLICLQKFFATRYSDSSSETSGNSYFN